MTLHFRHFLTFSSEFSHPCHVWPFIKSFPGASQPDSFTQSDIERNQMKKRGRNIKRKQILAKDPLCHGLISAIMLIGLKELADHISVPIKMFPPLRKCEEQHSRREHHKILKEGSSSSSIIWCLVTYVGHQNPPKEWTKLATIKTPLFFPFGKIMKDCRIRLKV